jgi:hypothetical protein
MKRQNSMQRELGTIHERDLQGKLHQMLILETRLMNGVSGNIIHIVNPGRINPYSGPDFLNMAIMINGELMIGNGEFHKIASDWFSHRHHLDPRYSDVLLHIVCEHDINIQVAKETLIIPYNEISATQTQVHSTTLHNLDDLQDYAFSRLMRRCNEVNELAYSIPDINEQLITYCMCFLRKRLNQRRRSFIKSEDLSGMIQMFIHSPIIYAIMNGSEIPLDITKLSFKARNGLYTHLFCELFVNSFYPYLVYLHKAYRKDLMEWFWLQRSFTKYGSLIRRFPDIPQQYMWQQQGILEYLRYEIFDGLSCREIHPTYLEHYYTVQ